ncbi:MAG: alternate F1F0 ATPase, F1 subunit alpha [Spirochaetia bacterium]
MSDKQLSDILDQAVDIIEVNALGKEYSLSREEVGRIIGVGEGIVRIKGFPGAAYQELVRFSGNYFGEVFNLDEEEVTAVLLDKDADLAAGDEVTRTGRIIDVPVGEHLLGRTIDPLGRPLDEKGSVEAAQRREVEQDAPAIMDRSPVNVPLQSGIRVIDSLIPIGRGQRELILGDRQTGKTAIALDTILNQKDNEVICVYCAIGQRSSAVARVISDLESYGMRDRTIVVVATGEDTPGLNFTAPYAAASMAEYFMYQGQDTLVVFDDLTRHARAYRELSLLMRRPPAREAYPGDIFYIHSRLLERSTHLSNDLSGGSMTALPIIETQAQNISAYIPTNLISITDGQIYLSPQLFQQGELPAIDVGKSVSRVGGKTQLRSYRKVAGDLRLSYSQFEELESFSRFGTRLDESTKQKLRHGRRVREIFKQDQYDPQPVAEQIVLLLSVKEGLFDKVALEDMDGAKQRVLEETRDQFAELFKKINTGQTIEENEQEQLLEEVKQTLQEFYQEDT